MESRQKKRGKLISLTRDGRMGDGEKREVDEEERLREDSRGREGGSGGEVVINRGVVGRKTRVGVGAMWHILLWILVI